MAFVSKKTCFGKLVVWSAVISAAGVLLLYNFPSDLPAAQDNMRTDSPTRTRTAPFNNTSQWKRRTVHDGAGIEEKVENYLELYEFELEQFLHYYNSAHPKPNPMPKNMLHTNFRATPPLQYMAKNYKSILERRRKEIRKQFVHEFSVSIKSRSHLVIHVVERVGNTSSKGGSGFFVRMRGSSIVTCKTEDHFNGSYTVMCPQTFGCSRVEVVLQTTNFDVYRQRDYTDCKAPLLMSLKNLTWCSSLNTTAIGTVDSSPHCRNHTLDSFNTGRWWKRGNDLAWGNRDGCLMHIVSREEAKTCYSKLTSLFIVGDSHIRYTGDYFLEVMGYNMKKVWHKHNHIKIDKTQFYYLPSLPDVVDTIHSKLLADKSRVRDASDVIVFNHPCWQFAYQGTIYFFDDDARKLVRAVAALKKDKYWKNARIIWMNHVAVAPNEYIAGWRDSFLGAAANYWIKRELVKLGIVPIDAHGMTLPRIESRVCVLHFMCRHGDGTSYGSTGMALGHLVFNHICRKDRL